MDETFDDTNKHDGINLFINLECIIRKMSTANIEDYLTVRDNDKVLEFVSNVVNLCSHYRAYFTRHKIQSRIYIYMTYPFEDCHFKNAMFVEEYRSYYVTKYSSNIKHTHLKDTINSAIPLLKIIVEYLFGVYFIHDNSMEITCVPLIVNKINDDNWHNMILTNDMYEYQYARFDKYSIMRPDRENSKILTNKNVIEYVFKGTNSNFTFTPEFLPFILSIIGDKQRSIPKLKSYGLTTIGKGIQKSIDDANISNDTTNIHLLLDIIKKEYHEQLLNNYYATDLSYQSALLNARDTHLITSLLIDKFNNSALQQLNDVYFEYHPMYLIELASYLKHGRKKIVF